MREPEIKTVMRKEYPVNLLKVADSEFAFVAETGDVQIGWCRQEVSGWTVKDMDERLLAGPFKDFMEAIVAGKEALSAEGGASNPGW